MITICRTGVPLAALAAAVLLAIAPPPAVAAEVDQTEKAPAIGNSFLELRFARRQEGWTVAKLHNKIGKRTIAIHTDDFAIGVEGRPPLRASDFRLVGVRKNVTPTRVGPKVRPPLRRKIDPGRDELRLQYRGKALDLKLDVVYEAPHRSPVVRRRLELTTPKPLAIRKVEVWRAQVAGKCGHQGHGEPVFLEDTFWGVEFPGAENRYVEGEVRLAHFPGRTVQGRFVSKWAVVGVAEAGRVARRFQEYVDHFQATPAGQARLFVNYNTWWTLMPPTEANCLALIDVFKKHLFDPHGESFDTFTIDDGWDDKRTLWSIRSGPFPRGFAPLLKPLASMKANLGLWLSPSSGYGHAPHLARQGYEHNSNKWFCCQAGPKYRREIVKTVTALAKKYDMAFFKFDGFSASCEAEGHGHLPGPYAREANIDAFIELMQAVRKARPGVYLDPTCGMWLSPWWLKYCDSIWGSVSGDYPSIRVPGPILRDSATTTRDAVFRQRCREHPGFPPSAVEHLGVIVITPEKWQDNAMAVVGRGARLLTLYVNPKFFQSPKADWAFLAAMLKWVRHNAGLLRKTRLILGEPLGREPYGFAHVHDGSGILSLRNPFIEPKTVEIDTEALKKDDAPDLLLPVDSVLTVVYPRREVLLDVRKPKITLGPYETLTVQFESLGGRVVALAGIRAVETAREEKRLTYTVYGLAGRKYDCELFAYTDIAKAALDLPGATATADRDGDGLQLRFPGQLAQCTVASARLAAQDADEAWKLVGSCTVNVPAASGATMHVLCDPKTSAAGKLQCAVTRNGKPLAVRALGPPARPTQTHGRHSWTWFSFDVPAGKSDVAIALSGGEGGGFFRGEVGWWLWARHPLLKSTLTVEFKGPIQDAKPEPLPLPIKIGHEDQVVVIQPPRVFHTGRRWPKDGRKVVYLDEVAPDQATQAWGTLQRKRSVWQKPMTIAGRRFQRGLGTHAAARLVYDLTGGKFSRFECLVGRDRHADDGRLIFQVRLDGKKVFDSGAMTRGTPAKPVKLDVSGADQLELIVLDGGDGISGDHADWADARLMR